ncbi:MAG: diheme cytochrome c [Thermodesulfobacteriota bacterium]
MHHVLMTIFCFCLALVINAFSLSASFPAETAGTKTPLKAGIKATVQPATQAPVKSPAPAPGKKAAVGEAPQSPDSGGTREDIYKKTCGQCHLAYPPEFLPAAFWGKLLAESDHHFGEALPLEPALKTLLSSYLKANGAEHSSSSKARKILESLNGTIPQRLTEVPYLVKKHRKITAEMLQRPAVGSLANCQACHADAEKGGFSSKVTIPQ